LKGDVGAEIGVAAGMSGSPVYINDELIGALSYRMGVMPRKAIAGVTPIATMLDAAQQAATTAPTSALARPIRTPLMTAGLHPALKEWAHEQLEAFGLEWSDGGAVSSGGASSAAGQPLEAGGPVGIALVRGDWTFAATGTVTLVDGDTVYAFGHPFVGNGSVEYPMVQAEVVHTLADSSGSQKLANVGAEIGMIVDDRLTAVVGRLDLRARTIPMSVTIQWPQGSPPGTTATAEMEVVDAPGLTPILVSLGVSNTILRRVDYENDVTVLAQGEIAFSGGRTLPFELSASGSNAVDPSSQIASQLQQTLGTLWNNPFEKAQVESIDVNISVEPSQRSYFLETLHYDREAVQPGATVEVQCVLKPWRGDAIKRTLQLTVPHGVSSGTGLRIAVGTPDQIQRALGNPLAARLQSSNDLGDVISVLGQLQATHRLVAILYQNSPTVTRDGVTYSDLPPTAAHLLSRGARVGGVSRSRVSLLGRAEIEMDGPIKGGLSMRVQIAGGSGDEEQASTAKEKRR
jgi:hypothetical protein